MSEEKTFRINLPTLFERVNERRREQGLPSVEPAIMAVRASIIFAIRQGKQTNLKGDQLDMDEAAADADDALARPLAELRAEVAELRTLLMGTVSAYTAGLDHLTAWAEDRYPPGPRINGLSLVASAGQQVIEDAVKKEGVNTVLKVLTTIVRDLTHARL